MLSLTILALAIALAITARRYWRLRRGVGLLAEAVSQRRPFLNDENTLPALHGSWRTLANACTALVHEVNRLKHQRAGHLTQLETTLGNLQEAVLIIDRNNYILLANRALRTFFPAARNIIGQRLEVVLHSAELLAYLNELQTAPTAAPREIEFVETDRTIWVEAVGALVPETAEQNGPWTLFVLHDITKQKQLENVRREFVANVSHELKTPLSVIKGYAETLDDDDGSMSPADRRQFVRTIHKHSDRLAAIVDDLLTLSRLESGAPDLHAAPEDLRDFIASIADEFRERFTKSQHLLELQIDGPELIARIDSLRLTQVYANLIDNAQKYTPAGSRIELGAKLSADAPEIIAWVADNGPGIPASDVPRIFERFYRVEKGRSREKGGTGLGLSIVKHIVHMHGGRVWVESEVGKGTRILFTLPLHRSSATASLPEATAKLSKA